LTTLKKVQSREKASTIKKKSKNLLFFSWKYFSKIKK
jgi:hypothetical protein